MDIYNGYTPHEKQDPFHKSTAKFRGIVTGIGFGKSAAGANEILKMAMMYPGCIHLIMAPTHKVLKFSTMVQFWKFCPKEIVKSIHKSDNTITLINDAQIIYLTADNDRHIDRLRGIEIGSFWADEAALFGHYFWKVIIGRLRDPKGPLNGWITTTPKGKGWPYWYFIRQLHPETRKPLKNAKDYEWFGGTTMDNPYTPEEYKKTLLDQYRGKFARQEIYGEVVAFEGAVYDNFSEELNVIRKVPKNLVSFEIGIDWGFTNEMACLIAGIDSDGRIYILKEYYQKKQVPDHLATWLDSQKKRFKISKGYADPSEPGHIHVLNTRGHHIVPADNDVMAGIQDVYAALDVADDDRPRLFIHQSCKNLLDEINEYRYAEIKEDREEKEQPIKVRDHAIDALRYLVRSRNTMNVRIGFLQDPDNLTGLY